MISKYSVFVVGTRRINSIFMLKKFSVPLTSESVTSGQAGGVFRQLFLQCRYLKGFEYIRMCFPPYSPVTGGKLKSPLPPLPFSHTWQTSKQRLEEGQVTYRGGQVDDRRQEERKRLEIRKWEWKQYYNTKSRKSVTNGKGETTDWCDMGAIERRIEKRGETAKIRWEIEWMTGERKQGRRKEAGDEKVRMKEIIRAENLSLTKKTRDYIERCDLLQVSCLFTLQLCQKYTS